MRAAANQVTHEVAVSHGVHFEKHANVSHISVFINLEQVYSLSILAEGAIALSVTLSGGVLFAS